MDETHSGDQIKALQAVFPSNDRLLLPLTKVPSCLCQAAMRKAVAATKNMSTGTRCQPTDLLYSMKGLAAPSRTPPQQKTPFCLH